MKNIIHKKQLLMLCAAFILQALACQAQVTHRDLLKKFQFPASGEGLVSQADFKPFPKSPEEWRKQLPDSVVKMLIKKGETALKQDFYPIPATVILEYVRTGNRTHYEKLSFVKRNMLWDLVMAEAVEGKGRFADHIADGVWSTCEESYWGLPVHLSIQKAGFGLPDVQDPTVDLFAAETASILAWTDYFAGEALSKVSPLLRPRIYAEVNRRILQPMETAKYAWMGGGNPNTRVNNWAPWIASNYLTSALLLEKNTGKRVDAVNRCMRITDQYLNSLGDEGGCDEGPLYWFAAGASAFDVLNLLGDASKGRINIYGDPFIKKIGAYIYKTHIGGHYFINVADAHPELEVDGQMIYRFGKLTNDQQLMDFGSWATYNIPLHEEDVQIFRRTRRLYNLFAEEAPQLKTPYHDMADVWFDDVQLMSSRSANGLFVATHGGNNNESHNHNDVGDVMIYADNYPVIIDVGSGTYTARTFSKDRYQLWFNTSAYHTLPVINGADQKDGQAFAARNIKYQKSPSHSSLTMDIAPSYPTAAGVKSWLRKVDLDKAGRISITDDYQLNAPVKSLTQTFMTVCDVDLNSPGKLIFALPSGKKINLTYDAAYWTVKKEKMELTSPEDQGLKGSWNHRDIYRLLLIAKKPSAQAKLTYNVYR